MFTSVGFHTFSISLRLTREEAQSLLDTFFKSSDLYMINDVMRNKYRDDSSGKMAPESDTYYTFKYREKYKGLTWILRFSNRTFRRVYEMDVPDDEPCSIKATINPKILCGINDYVTAASASCLDGVIESFNIEAEKISPLLKNFDEYSLNRIDYYINFDLRELGINCSIEQMMKLIKEGNIPKHFEELMLYRDESKSHRMTSDPTSFYLSNNSVTINCYQKHHQLLKEFPDAPDIDDSLNVIRFEVQCGYLKVYHLMRRVKNIDGFINRIHGVLSDNWSDLTVRHYLTKIIGRGDYYTLDEARERIISKHFNQNKRDRLIWVLEAVNEARGVWKARFKLNPIEWKIVKQSLRDFNAIGINPVTIPRDWNIKHIPNIMIAYYLKIEEEESRKAHEEARKSLLTEYANKKKKKKKH